MTRYEPPAIQSGPSPGCTHSWSRSRSVSSALRLAVPSLKPKRLRGGGLVPGGRRGTAEAELRPADAHHAHADPGQVADRVHRHLRVVGAGLDAEVAAGELRLQRVAGELRQLGQGGGPTVGEAEAVPPVGVAEQRRPEADGEGELRGRQAERLTGVVRRGLRHAADRAEHPGVPPRGHPGGGGRPLLKQFDQPGPVLGDHVERHEVQPVLRRGDDAGLVLTVERHRPGRVVARRGRAMASRSAAPPRRPPLRRPRPPRRRPA